MNTILTFIRRMAGLIVLAALGTAVLSSCKEDDPVPTPLDAPQARLVAATVSSLTFTWDKVTDAVQYGYQLVGPDGSDLDGGTTTATSAVFTGLKDNTTYMVRIYAFAAVAEPSLGTSAAFEVQGKTEAIVPLATPVLKVEAGEGTAAISWEAVDNADSYAYSYVVDGGTPVTGSTEDTSLTLLKLEAGNYVFYLRAVSENEAYSDSEEAMAEFEVKSAARRESWRVTGSVDDGGGNTWAATMVAWSDGTYTLKDWYNVEGYDLEFYLNADGSLSVTNYYEPYYPNIWVIAGDDIDNGWVHLYTATYGSSYYSYFDGDRTEGYFYCYSYRTAGYYQFTWASSGDSVTVDDIVGTYSQNNTYQFWYNSAWNNYSSTNDVTVTKVDDTTVSIEGFMYALSDGGKAINAVLDAGRGTLSISPQNVDEWYKLAGQEAETDSVTVIWENGVLTFGDWSLWYDGYQYAYSTETVLTKK
ncbi:MAG: fibronectin type III domain-containing protein [Bacteroidia bacterium]|nr:fibronectin type III domain-containing protein [Bacteroidia bacterium]